MLYPFDDVIATYLRAAEIAPDRAEPLHGAGRLCRKFGRNKEGYEITKRGLALAPPENGVSIEPWIYDYGLLDEFAINAYWASRYRESLDACIQLLERATLPASQRDRVAANARFALAKLPGDPNIGSPAARISTDLHQMDAPRQLYSALPQVPKVFVATFVAQDERFLPLYLTRIASLDYPKSALVIYLSAYESSERSVAILQEWIRQVGHLYAAVELDCSDIPERKLDDAAFGWRFNKTHTIGRQRNISLRKALDFDCDFYLVSDTYHSVRSCTLRELSALNLPIVSPLLRQANRHSQYSNYHAAVDANGYFASCDQYGWILEMYVQGLIEVPVVNGTYLIRSDVISFLNYEDMSGRDEYVVFSESARKYNIPQYLDNRQLYGYIGLVDAPDQIELTANFRDDEYYIPHGQPRPDRSFPTTQLRPKQRTLVFCTAFSRSARTWERRYRRWLDAIRGSGLAKDQILMVDDGSPVLPNWHDLTIVHEQNCLGSDDEAILYHFGSHLGRRAVFDFEGWYRSFLFAGKYAAERGFDKIIHIESDAFLISRRVQDYFNRLSDTWTALWCPRHNLPETGLQVIAGTYVEKLANLDKILPHSALVGKAFELQLPFSHIDRSFRGDRYRESLPYVPGVADYACATGNLDSDPALTTQTVTTASSNYYWWLKRKGNIASTADESLYSTEDIRDVIEEPGAIIYYGDGKTRFGKILQTFSSMLEEYDSLSTELCAIMKDEGSDKGAGWHNYTLLYHLLFQSRREKIFNVFEMGIGTNFTDVPFNMGPCGTPGASLRGWRRYFPNAAVFGGDVDGRVLFNAPGITTFQVDQTAPESIHKLWALLSDVRFDLIIDDGLHSYDGNTTFLKNSYKRLSDNGFHVIEDIAINEANLQQFHSFFRGSGLHGFLIRIPHSTNREDNCIAFLQ